MGNDTGVTERQEKLQSNDDGNFLVNLPSEGTSIELNDGKNSTGETKGCIDQGNVSQVTSVSGGLRSNLPLNANRTPAPIQHHTSTMAQRDSEIAPRFPNPQEPEVPAIPIERSNLKDFQIHCQSPFNSSPVGGGHQKQFSPSANECPPKTSQQIQTHVPASSSQIDRILKKKSQFFDQICKTILMSIGKQNNVTRKKQALFKEYIGHVYTQWFIRDLSRTQMQNSITSLLHEMFPEAEEVDLNALFEIWDDYDLQKVKESEMADVNRPCQRASGSSEARSSEASKPSASSATTSRSTLTKASSRKDPSDEKQFYSSLTQEQIVVGHFCRHSIKLLSHIMQGNPEASNKEAQLKDHIKEVWAQWVGNQISRSQLLESVATCVRGTCPEAQGVDVVEEFKVWYELEFENQAQHKVGAVNNVNIEQSLRVPNVATIQSLVQGSASHQPKNTDDLTTKSPHAAGVRPPGHSQQPSVAPGNQRRQPAGRLITQEQIIVGHFCRYSIKLLSHVMDGNPDCHKKGAQLKDHIKKVWAQWVKSQISRPQLLDSVATFVRGTCPEAEGIDVIGEFKVWYEREFEMQRQRRGGVRINGVGSDNAVHSSNTQVETPTTMTNTGRAAASPNPMADSL